MFPRSKHCLRRLHLRLRLRHARMQGHLLPEVWRGMFWVALSGLVFCLLNTLVRAITLTLDPFESQFLRYLFSVVAMAPLVLRQGWRSYIPVNLAGQWWRGAVHTLGLMFWLLPCPTSGWLTPPPSALPGRSSSCWGRPGFWAKKCTPTAGWLPCSALPGCWW
jgi:hypothetical protein